MKVSDAEFSLFVSRCSRKNIDYIWRVTKPIMHTPRADRIQYLEMKKAFPRRSRICTGSIYLRHARSWHGCPSASVV